MIGSELDIIKYLTTHESKYVKVIQCKNSMSYSLNLDIEVENYIRFVSI